MPLPESGQPSWADDLNAYLLGAAVEVQGDLEVVVGAAGDVLAELLAGISDAEAAWIGLYGGTQGLALDTDGVPYFDADYDPEVPATLALVLDTDGVPYLAGVPS
ncbi:MAG: hypothetical protein CMF72_24710 [Mameliella sp.]|nr:hypothetical protein [Mameliella sp.]|tara:strand:- start:3798 stop:4112 length:315 start_codon:yes stop_codon:yes gene_type:complete